MWYNGMFRPPTDIGMLSLSRRSTRPAVDCTTVARWDIKMGERGGAVIPVVGIWVTDTRVGGKGAIGYEASGSGLLGPTGVVERSTGSTERK